MGQEITTAAFSQGKLTLKTAAAYINRLHEEATKQCKVGLEKARDVGAALAEAKAAIKHGAFEAWVNSECDFSVRSARRYMTIFSKWDELIEQHGPGQMSIITLEDGIAKLTQSRKERKAPTTKPEPVPASEPCFKGGDHQWEADPELSGDYCAKCHEQRPDVREADDEDPEEHYGTEGSGAKKETAPSVAARRVGSHSLTRLVQLLKEAVDLVDEANQESPSPLHSDIFDSLNVAYQDALKWSKQMPHT
jgi:hypothetical protein